MVDEAHPFTVAAVWDEFSRKVLPEDVSEQQRFDTMVSFYAGFGSAAFGFKILLEVAPKDMVVSMLERLTQEVDDLRVSELRRRGQA